MDIGLEPARAFLSILKVVLGLLAVVFLVVFYARWRMTKHNLSMMAFYTKWKFVKHNVVMGVGIAALALAFVIEYLAEAGLSSQYELSVPRYVLELFALVCVSYSYYKLARLEIPE